MSHKRKSSGGVRYSRSNETSEKRQARYLWLAMLLAILIAAAFGAVLYCINIQGRI